MSGHFGRFTADERGARLAAAFGDTTDDGLGYVDAQLACRVVVEKEEGLGPLDHDVVGAHRDQIDADRVVSACVDGEAQFRAHAVGPRHEYGSFIACWQLDECAKAADARKDFGSLRALYDRFDALNELVAGVDVDTPRRDR